MIVSVALAALSVAAVPGAGIDWGEGIVRVPAPVIERPSGEIETLRPSRDSVALYLLECLWAVQIDSDIQVKAVFESPEDFCDVVRDVSGRLRDGFFEVPFGGDDGLVMRILHPEAFRPAAPPEESAPASEPDPAASFTAEEARSMGMVVSERI
ncbi:MAG: hypothetical protein JXR94_14045 [Candidatus Hydrogenedentes bacterium]|nr:hypothetical protein [Candidatus Hydrogenedentota bacterium]